MARSIFQAAAPCASVRSSRPGSSAPKPTICTAASPDFDGLDHDLISLIEHALRANALRLSRGKPGFHFSGSCSRRSAADSGIVVDQFPGDRLDQAVGVPLVQLVPLAALVLDFPARGRLARDEDSL